MAMMTGAGASGAAHARDGPGRAPLEVPHERTGVGVARHTVADQLTAVGLREASCDDALLVLSELVSNAVTHAAPLPNGRITVGWTVLDDALHLEITDGGSVTRPQASVAALFSGSGRGLDIVRTICRAWGVTEGERSVTVWADVPMSPMSPVPAPPVAPDG
jgi:anti-sigma regulatory factor (Ser/Thr protein kinase)